MTTPLSPARVRHVGNCGDAEVPVDEVVRAWAALLRCSCNVIGKLLSTHQQGFLKFLQHGHGSLGQKKFDVILAEVATCNPEAGPVLTLDADSQAIFPPMGPEKLLGNSDFLVELFPILGPSPPPSPLLLRSHRHVVNHCHGNEPFPGAVAQATSNTPMRSKKTL